MATDSNLWSQTYDRELDDVFAVQDDIAQAVVEELRTALPGGDKGTVATASAVAAVQAAVSGRTHNPEAWRLYLMGRGYLRGNQQEMDKGVDFFQQAVDRAPDYAMAYAGLAEAWTTQTHLRAVDRASFVDKARAAVTRALELDPLAVGPIHNLAIIHMAQGDYEQAAAGFRRAIDINPNWTWGYIKLARTLVLQKKCTEALAQAEIGERRIAGGAAPLSWSWLGVTYALCGDVTRARGKLAQLHALEEKQYVDPVTFAQIHSALGEMDQSIRWYEKAFADRTPNMVYAPAMPGLSPELVGNARYQAIVDRMGFPRTDLTPR